PPTPIAAKTGVSAGVAAVGGGTASWTTLNQTPWASESAPALSSTPFVRATDRAMTGTSATASTTPMAVGMSWAIWPSSEHRTTAGEPARGAKNELSQNL